MPVPFLAEAVFGGWTPTPYLWTILKTLPWLGLIYLLRIYFGGATNSSERMMHSKVVMITVSLAKLRT